MSGTPTVSVIMAAFNSQKYLAQAIESILNQTLKDLEFIIIDDGSTDNTSEIINTYQNIDERIIHLKNEENRGLPASLNKGLDIASGKYIARMDGDDFSEINRLETQVNHLENNKGIDILGCSMRIISANGDPTGEIWSYSNNPSELSLETFFLSPVPHAAIVARRAVFNHPIERYNEEYLVAQDYELWSRLITKYNFSNLSIPLYNCRFFRNSINPVRQKLTNEIRKSQLSTRLKLNISKSEWKTHKFIFLFNNQEREDNVSLDDIKLWLNKFINSTIEHTIAPGKTIIEYLKKKKFIEIALRKKVRINKNSFLKTIGITWGLNEKWFGFPYKFFLSLKLLRDFTT